MGHPLYFSVGKYFRFRRNLPLGMGRVRSRGLSFSYSFKECYIRILGNLSYFRTESTGDGPRLCRRPPPTPSGVRPMGAPSVAPCVWVWPFFRGRNRKKHLIIIDRIQDGPKSAQDAPREPQDRLKIAQDGPKSPQDGPKIGPDGPNMSQDGPKTPPEGPKIASRSPKMAPRAPKTDPGAPKIAPRAPKMSQRCPEVRPS